MTSKTTEKARQIAFQKIIDDKKNSMLHLNSAQDSIEHILDSITDEAENNFAKILNYLNNDFSYQDHYFDLANVVFIPGIFRQKNQTFYIFGFTKKFKSAQLRRLIPQVQKQYPTIKIRIIKFIQYKRIIQHFQKKIDNLVIKNYSAYLCTAKKCKYCKKKFQRTDKSQLFCSDECAHQYHLEYESKRNYYSGYYMDIHHYVRSGWEHNVAKILQWSQLDYDYEQVKFKLSNGSIYIPDFYVYADNTFYEVKGEQRERSMTKIDLFRQDYPDKRLVVIDSKVYHSLIKQFQHINLDRHIVLADNPSKFNNINCYRHDKVHYEDWELNYRYFTNQRYDYQNKNLININEASQILNMSKIKLVKLTNSGRLQYYIVNNKIYYDKNYIEFFHDTQDLKTECNTAYINRITQINEKEMTKKCPWCGEEFTTTSSCQQFCSKLCARRAYRRNEQLKRYASINKKSSKTTAKIDLKLDVKQQMAIQQQNAVNKHLLENRLDLRYDAEKNQLKKGKKIIDNLDSLSINNEYKHLIELCFKYKLSFQFETKSLLLNNGKLLVLPLFIENDQTYYFCIFNDNPNKMKKVKTFIAEYGHRIKYKVITKREYDFITTFKEEVSENIDVNNIVCQHCGKKITKRGILRKGVVRKYCSNECLLASKKCEVEQECLYCHNKFMIKNIRDKTYKQFCCDECALKYKEDLSKGLIQLPISSAKNVKLIFQENECKRCNKKIYYISNRKHEFCCEDCRRIYTNEHKVIK